MRARPQHCAWTRLHNHSNCSVPRITYHCPGSGQAGPAARPSRCSLVRSSLRLRLRGPEPVKLEPLRVVPRLEAPPAEHSVIGATTVCTGIAVMTVDTQVGLLHAVAFRALARRHAIGATQLHGATAATDAGCPRALHRLCVSWRGSWRRVHPRRVSVGRCGPVECGCGCACACDGVPRGAAEGLASVLGRWRRRSATTTRTNTPAIVTTTTASRGIAARNG